MCCVTVAISILQFAYTSAMVSAIKFTKMQQGELQAWHDAELSQYSVAESISCSQQVSCRILGNLTGTEYPNQLGEEANRIQPATSFIRKCRVKVLNRKRFLQEDIWLPIAKSMQTTLKKYWHSEFKKLLNFSQLTSECRASQKQCVELHITCSLQEWMRLFFGQKTKAFEGRDVFP